VWQAGGIRHILALSVWDAGSVRREDRMKRLLFAGLALALAACSSAVPLPFVGGGFGTPSIDVTAGKKGVDWTVRYRLPQPATQLVFARSTDDSRTRMWRTDSAFEIVSTPQGEIARRRDGAAFSEARFRMAPVYHVLPKDYAPFSPFGDGGMLFHTGRLFACAMECPDDARFAFHLTAPGRILLNGNRTIYLADWTDEEDGRNVYLGEALPLTTPDLVAVFDRSLPDQIRDSLSSEFPPLMRQLAEKLGKLEQRPVLFASYSVASDAGWGRQGGALPGQVFVHFYGDRWPVEMSKPDFGPSLTWFFAHEAAHVLQRNLYIPGDAGAWIHEGAAEAFAAMAVRQTSAGNAYVDQQIETARAKCDADRKGRSMREALSAGAFDVSYSCGLLLNLAIDTSIRRSNPAADGLYTVWRDHMDRNAAKRPSTEDDFLASISRIGGERLASAVHAQLRTAEPNFDAL
jgi:hypothetical protein